MTFKEQTNHPKWQRRRLEILDRDNYTCVECGDKETTLNVHHDYYVYGNDYWDYPDSCFRTLCNGCHKRWHIENKRPSKCITKIDRVRAISRMISDKCHILGSEYYHELCSLVESDGEDVMNSCSCSEIIEYEGLTGFDILEAAIYYDVKHQDYAWYATWLLCIGSVTTPEECRMEDASIREFLSKNEN